MGWWDEGIFGGDTPLDILLDIEDFLGLDRDNNERIYGLEMFKDNEQLQLLVRDRINLRWRDFQKEHDVLVKNCRHDSEIITQVFAAVILGSGARMPEEFRQKALEAGKNDTWASEDDVRRARIDAYITAVKNYKDGCPVILEEHGLFEKFLNQ